VLVGAGDCVGTGVAVFVGIGETVGVGVLEAVGAGVTEGVGEFVGAGLDGLTLPTSAYFVGGSPYEPPITSWRSLDR
jgi:hypothetical protein